MVQATSHLDHTVDEHIEIKEYLEAIAVYKETLLRLSELHNSKNGNSKASEDNNRLISCFYKSFLKQ